VDSSLQRTAIVGFGNPIYGDDAVGLVVARRVHERVRHQGNVDVLELSTSDFGLVEHLIGYRKAVIIDASIDETAEVGTTTRAELPESCGCSLLSPHAGGLGDALDLARNLGLCVPGEISVYGIAVREPEGFSDCLTRKLETELPQVVQRIIDAEFGPIMYDE
jgi:hydrogenase maturation protease